MSEVILPPAGGGEGLLSVTVWPVYIGLALEGSTPGRMLSVDEPHNGGYQRGQITWYPTDDGNIVGRARIAAPAGTYTHFVYFKHPTSPQAVGATKIPHPITLTAPVNFLDVDPIVNTDNKICR